MRVPVLIEGSIELDPTIINGCAVPADMTRAAYEARHPTVAITRTTIVLMNRVRFVKYVANSAHKFPGD